MSNLVGSGFADENNNNKISLLPLQDQFAIARLKTQMELMSTAQLKEMVETLMVSLAHQKKTYNELLAKEWGMAGNESFIP